MSEQAKATATGDAWTVLRLLTWTTDFFRQRGSDSPRLDAEVLLAHALDCSRIELYTAYSSEPGDEARSRFRELVRQRGDGVPVAYLVGFREFYSLRLQVTPAVLIPRPETEHVVILALDRAKELAKQASAGPLRIADVGTGSGAIAIAVAKHLDTVYPAGGQLTAIDLSPQALEVARANATTHQVADRIDFRLGDLLEPVAAEPTFQLVLSNPPYVSQAEYDDLPAMVRDHEPSLALLAGPDGTEVISRLIDQAAPRLVADGQLIIELSPMIADSCGDRIAADDRFGSPSFTKDFAGHRRVLVATRR